LTESEYLEIVTAKRRLVILVGIEEKFDLLFANYGEYESTLLNLSLENMLGYSNSYSHFHDARGLVNRRLLNLLSSTRAYVDQVTHDVGELAGASAKDQAKDHLKTLFSGEYDGHLAYRVLEALRNYVQHRSLAVGSLSFGSKWFEQLTPRARRRHSLQVYLDTDALVGDDYFKSSVLQELRASGKGNVLLTPMVRQYVDCFGHVHRQLRTYVEATAREAENLFRGTHERGVANCGGKPVGIVVRRESSDGVRLEQHDIFLDLIDRRREFESRNGTSLNLSQGYVSTEVSDQ
jgi:hypothetical protein